MIQHLSAGKLSMPKLLIFLSTHQLSYVARIEQLDSLELRRKLLSCYFMEEGRCSSVPHRTALTSVDTRPSDG